MPIILYYLKLSPPVRAVVLTAKALNLDVELKTLDMMIKREHMTPEFLKMNPMHTVPTLDDNGFIVFDSHAINAYLVNKYGKTDALYPREAKARAIVDQRLHFDSGILFPRLRAIAFPILTGKTKEIAEEKVEAAREAYDFLSKLLGDNEWLAGKSMTIADFCCVSTVTSLDFMVTGMDKYPNITAWINRCKENAPGYNEAIQDGLDAFKTVFNAKLA